jgi:hypothetical protein
MEGNTMTRYLLALALLAGTITSAHAQEDSSPTQALVAFDSKTPSTPTAKDITLKIDNRATPLMNLTPVPSNGAQIALLIDDGLRTSIGRELGTLRSFIAGLPAGTEVFVGYMQNGRVVSGSDNSGFTANLAAAAQSLRIPSGIPGSSASPYFCVSDFVKNWPSNAEDQIAQQTSQNGQPIHKARFVLMISNGVDPYNGSTSIMNQDSPYVASAILDAQRAGVPVYAIYFSDAGLGMRGGRASFSGQSYLQQLADGTGGVSYYQGSGNPVSTAPYLKQFQASVAESYVITFPVAANKKLVSVKASTSLPKTKVRAPQQVRPGTIVLSQP